MKKVLLGIVVVLVLAGAPLGWHFMSSCSVSFAHGEDSLQNSCSNVEIVEYNSETDRFLLKVDMTAKKMMYTETTYDENANMAETGYSFNIGDSETNNGSGGDSSTQSRDAEIDVYNGKFRYYAGDNGRSEFGGPLDPFDAQHVLVNTPGVEAGSTLKVTITNEYMDAYISEKVGRTITSPYGFAFANHSDLEGKVNNDLYVAVNRVVLSNNETGSGVKKFFMKIR